MTPTHDATSTGQQTAAGTTLTYSHTIGASANYLKVGVGANNAGPGPITGITWNGVSMTRLGSELAPDGFIVVDYYFLVSPATGTHNVVVTTTNSTDALASCASSYNDVDTTTPHGTAATATGTTNTPTVNVSSAAGELVVDVVGVRDTTLTACGQTQRGNVNDTGPNIANGAADAAGAASVTMSWTAGAATAWGIIGVSLKGATAVTLKQVGKCIYVMP
jgi:hypothetical protein